VRPPRYRQSCQIRLVAHLAPTRVSAPWVRRSGALWDQACHHLA